MEVRAVGAVRADRRTDVTKLVVAFRNFANAPKMTAQDTRILQYDPETAPKSAVKSILLPKMERSENVKVKYEKHACLLLFLFFCGVTAQLGPRVPHC
jgi:hypothetical protein